MQAKLFSKNSILIAVLMMLFLSFLTQNTRAETPLTAGVVLEKMPSNEFVVYVAGIVEGLAYARFRKDTVAAGKKVEKGMSCIRNWYHGNDNAILNIESAFRKYKQYAPWIVIAAMVKKECGE